MATVVVVRGKNDVYFCCLVIRCGYFGGTCIVVKASTNPSRSLVLLPLLLLALLCGAWRMPSINISRASNTKNKRKNTGVRLRRRREVLVLVLARLVVRLGIIDRVVVVAVAVGVLAISLVALLVLATLNGLLDLFFF